MAESHRNEAWQHTSTIIATLANIHRDPKKKPKPFSPGDFQPVSKTPEQPVKADFRLLKQVFVKSNPA